MHIDWPMRLPAITPERRRSEITLVGPELEFADDRIVAVTGATFDLTVSDRPVPMHRQCLP